MNPADVSVQLLQEIPAPPEGEDVLGAQAHVMVSRPGPARSAPAQMPAIMEHPQMPPAASTPVAPDVTPPAVPTASATTPEQPGPGDYGQSLPGQYPPPGRDQVVYYEAVNPNEIARQVAAIVMSQPGFQMPFQPSVAQHQLYLDPALAGCQPIPMHPNADLTLSERVPFSAEANLDHVIKLQESVELSTHAARAILEDFNAVCHAGRAEENDPDSFVKAADPSLIAAAVTAACVLEVLQLVQEVTKNNLLQPGLLKTAASHPAIFTWMSNKFRDITVVFNPKLKWTSKFRPSTSIFNEDGYQLARALLYQPRLRTLREKAATWKQWSSNRAIESQLENLRLDYSMAVSPVALRRSRLHASSIEVTNANAKMSNKKRPREGQFREPFPRNRGLAVRGRQLEEEQTSRFQRR